MFRHKHLVLFILAWIIATSSGFHLLLTYKSRAGVEVHPPSIWPANNKIKLASRQPLLVMFAHPRCPCTEASLAQLEQLAARANKQFKAAVVFCEPKDAPGDWSSSALMRQAKAIPGVEVIPDKDAELTTQFQVQTSGHTLVYSPEGNLLFSGGITSSRGHIGDNNGFSKVLKIIRTHSADLTCSSTPVFGCELGTPCARNKTSNQN